MAAHPKANGPPKAKERCERPPPSIAGTDEPADPFIRLFFRQMNLSAPTAPDFAAPHCFSKSKSACADAWGENRAIHAIWTPQNGGKKGGCVLSRAKLLILFRMSAISRGKSFKTIEKCRLPTKTSGLSFEFPLFFAHTTLVFGGSRRGAASPPSPSRFPTCTDTPGRTRPHAHRALSEFAFLAFTLHRREQPAEHQRN